jgi:methyl-accepting chemotaxis protein
MGILLACILAVAALVIFLSVAGTVRQMRRLGVRMREIASGRSDLRSRARIIAFDEVGLLASDFNAVMDNLEGIIGDVRALAAGVLASSGSLDALAKRADESMLGLQRELALVRGSVGEQDGTMAQAQEAISGMGASIDEVAGEVEEESGLVERSSASITQMTANISAVSASTEKAAELSARLLGTAESGGKTADDLVRSVRAISEASAAVEQIIGSISKISAQTNLLAMNAAIEAAHAGEAGAGFSIVADEVRSLAVTSASSAKEIVALIREMESRIQAGSQLSERAGAAFKDIAALAQESSRLVEGIARSMAEQRLGNQEVLATVTALTEANRKIRELAARQRSHSADMSGAMDSIVMSAARIKQAVDAEDAASGQLSQVVRAVQRESEAHARAAGELDRRIEGFTVGAQA